MNRSNQVGVAGTAYAVGGVLWFALAITMGILFGGDPQADSAAFVPSQVLWVVVQALLLFGFMGLLWSQGVGQGLFGKLAFALGALGHLVFLVGEIHSLTSGVISDLVPAAAMVSAIGLLLTGIAVLRAKQWQGWTRWLPLLTGLYPWVVMFPFIAITGDINIFAIGGWGLVRLALGLAMRNQVAMPKERLSAAVIAAQNRV